MTGQEAAILGADDPDDGILGTAESHDVIVTRVVAKCEQRARQQPYSCVTRHVIDNNNNITIVFISSMVQIEGPIGHVASTSQSDWLLIKLHYGLLKYVQTNGN